MSQKQNNYKKERQKLHAIGVSNNVIEHVLSKNPSKKPYIFLNFMFMAIMVMGLIGIFISIEFLEKEIESRIIATSKTIDIVLYYHNSGIGQLIGMFAWILASGSLIYLISNSNAIFRNSVFVYSLIDKRNASFNRFLKLMQTTENDPEEFTKIILNRAARILLIPTFLLASIAFIFIEFENDAYKMYTHQGFIHKPLLPWKPDITGHWRDAIYVELGCNRVTGKNASDDIIYEVGVRGGYSHRLSSANPLQGEWIDHIERIDQSIMEGNADFRRWKWLKRNPLHPECLKTQSRRYNEQDYQRILKLLRVESL